ncbi:MAG: hypothetical protein DRJ50_13790, partial [Actinobacteria bacterium]
MPPCAQPAPDRRNHESEHIVSQKKSSTKKRVAKNTEAEQNPWPRRFGIGAAVGVVGLLVTIVAFNSPPARGIPDGTETVAVGPAQHVEGDIHADGEVPAGGSHSEVWQNCGFYDEEIRSENAVHALEHGAVWITYRADLQNHDIDRLRGFIRSPDKVLISPVAGQVPAAIATAW